MGRAAWDVLPEQGFHGRGCMSSTGRAACRDASPTTVIHSGVDGPAEYCSIGAAPQVT